MTNIFLVEDDEAIVRSLCRLLEAEGFAVTSASDCRQARERYRPGRFDLALIDLSLPDGSGFSLCTALREAGAIPVIFLTASGDESSVVTGLSLGADDYIVKPFRPRELIARIGAALRRNSRAGAVLTFGKLSADPASGIVRKDGREIFLSALEYRLLLLFLGSPNRILTRAGLLESIWDAAGEFVSDNTLTVYIKRLREKVEDDPAHPKIILTVRGIGYRLGDSHAAE